ncbi:ARM repeat-containing protein [Gymnopus androsaceus JB14]|uniref:ARM repeat-containing protein n=1 Tax=Gymnopus androsaceus JB14 TaxID=1447944 RepID=A0A6A4GQ87_9AGAR|nr:ARM repeat-containing protein [Gymnopus androsaceus JB14]
MHSTVIVSQTPLSLSPYPLALSQYPLYRMDSSHTYSRSSHLPDISNVTLIIIVWANKSKKEKDGRTLLQVIHLVFEKAIDDTTRSEMYARLCRKIMEHISPNVQACQDDGIKDLEGYSIAGGHLFRKYLLNMCQEEYERGWVNMEATTGAVDENHAANWLLASVENPQEEDIEALCMLLTTVGAILDTAKGRAHMDVYFGRRKELMQSQNEGSRLRFMLQDVIELRGRAYYTYRYRSSSVGIIASFALLCTRHDALRSIMHIYVPFIVNSGLRRSCLNFNVFEGELGTTGVSLAIDEKAHMRADSLTVSFLHIFALFCTAQSTSNISESILQNAAADGINLAALNFTDLVLNEIVGIYDSAQCSNNSGDSSSNGSRIDVHSMKLLFFESNVPLISKPPVPQLTLSQTGIGPSFLSQAESPLPNGTLLPHSPSWILRTSTDLS